MSTSKYGQDAGSERDISIPVGELPIHFTVEPVKRKKEEKRERLRLAFGMARDRANASKSWEDSDESSLDDRLTDVLVEMLVGAEASYRNSLVRHRDWTIERKAAAEAELKRRRKKLNVRRASFRKSLQGSEFRSCSLRLKRSTVPIRSGLMWSPCVREPQKRRLRGPTSTNGRCGHLRKRIVSTP